MDQKNLIITYRLTACVLILILCACSNEPAPEASTKYSTAEEVLTLDNQNSSEDTPLVSAVSLVTTDNETNIYLVDPVELKIHSYTNNLSHRWTKGGKGDGPGLFNQISALYVDEQHLYVYEYANSTMTQYTLSGERLTEWSFGESGHPLNSIHLMPNGSFVAAGLNEQDNTILNIYSDDFKSRVSHFINIDEISKTESLKLEKQVFRSYPGSVMPAGDSTVIYAPGAYSGQLPVYSMSSAGNWEKAAMLQGYKNIEPPLFFSESSDGNNDRSLLSGYDPNNGNYFHTEFNSMSRGLYNLSDGRTAHLSLWLNDNDKWDLVVEYFDLNTLKLEDHIIIKDQIPSLQLEQMPAWMDKNGQIYMYENSDTPLRVLKINDNLAN